jgi:recombination protein RecR
MLYAEPLARLIEELTKLPGVGPRTAQRLAFHFLSVSSGEVESLAAALLAAKRDMRHCATCFNLTDVDPCRICASGDRDQSIICIVEDPRAVAAMEKTRDYRGLYHVLHGAISPLDGIGPDRIKARELLPRVAAGTCREVILATDPDTEGEATAMYLARLLKPLGVRVTRLARGLPVGGELEYADEVTLSKAIEGRRDV